jgi:hypothetical protein
LITAAAPKRSMRSRASMTLLVQDDRVALDPPHVPQADDVLDPAEKRQLALSNHGAAEHGRCEGGIDAKEEPLCFERLQYRFSVPSKSL